MADERASAPRIAESTTTGNRAPLVAGDIVSPSVSLSADAASAAAAAIIRANGGAVTAEQLAPLLAPPLDPAQAEEEASRPGAPVREDWMLPLLLQFNGEPVVTDEGDLVYVFDELMATAEDDDKDSAVAISSSKT